MNDLQALEDFFLVDDVAERMGWTVVPSLIGQSVRALQALAGNPDTHPDDVMKAVAHLKVAIGPMNLAAVICHELWDDWCPCQLDPAQFDNGSGAVIWAGNRGLVKCLDSGEGAEIALLAIAPK
jgi:hypothetical protein